MIQFAAFAECAQIAEFFEVIETDKFYHKGVVADFAEITKIIETFEIADSAKNSQIV